MQRNSQAVISIIFPWMRSF